MMIFSCLSDETRCISLNNQNLSDLTTSKA